VLEDIATQAGLTHEQAFDVTWALKLRGEETMTRALVAPAGIAVLVGPEREPEFKQALIEGLAPRRHADGSYRLNNEYHFLIARA
jgi:hypothetical protein